MYLQRYNAKTAIHALNWHANPVSAIDMQCCTAKLVLQVGLDRCILIQLYTDTAS